MQDYFLSDNEREQHQRFPAEIPSPDVSDYFTLSAADRHRVNRQRGDHNRLGFALQLCALRYLGFTPNELTNAPASVVMFVADQLRVSPMCLSTYGQRAHTRTDHLQEILDYLGYRKATPADWRHLRSWLMERALEHDKPTLLLQLACEKLRREKIVRPAITRLERLVLQVRQDGQAETYQRLTPWLRADRRQLLDQLLIVDLALRRTPLTWLRQAATTTLVNFHYHQPLSRYWGGGALSSSDGQRFPVSGKVRHATALPRYFGYGRGVTFYTWTSDQFSQYGTKVIPATVRDATYVLDEILDNETELPLVEHTTDTAGYTEIVFALFDLLGLQFSPRIRDIGGQQLYGLDRASTYPNLRPLLKGRIKRSLILSRWDDMVRVAGSLKLGWVTASLFLSKLQAYPRRNALSVALQEYGRLIKTLFILRYL